MRVRGVEARCRCAFECARDAQYASVCCRDDIFMLLTLMLLMLMPPRHADIFFFSAIFAAMPLRRHFDAAMPPGRHVSRRYADTFAA